MSDFDPIALVVGWLVIGGLALVGIAAAWWIAGELVWSRVFPSRWKRRGFVAVHGHLRVTPLRVAIMFLLGGPLALQHRRPRIVSYKRLKQARAKEAESLVRIEAAEAALNEERKANG